MATFDYAATKEDVEALLVEFGMPIVLKRYTKVADKVSEEVTKVLRAQQTLQSAVLPASQGTLEAFDVRFMQDVMTQTNVRFAIMSAARITRLPTGEFLWDTAAVSFDDGESSWDGLWASDKWFEPQPNDEAEFFDGTWQVLGCTPLNVVGIPLLYSVGFRKP